MTNRTCIACKHFHLSPSYRYSSMTYGDGYITCLVRKFSYESVEETVEFSMSKAVDCDKYELSELAKAKGWIE